MEQPRVALLMQRLELAPKYRNPNAGHAVETGADVLAIIAGRRIGVQVTDLDTGKTAGEARAAEKKLERDAKSRDSTYDTYAQNDPKKIIDAVVRSITRKARISSAGFNEFWLLICAGVPEMGAIGSTSAMTPWMKINALNDATLHLLSTSKYNRAFIYSILGVEEQALYQWQRGSDWSKSVRVVPLDEQARDFWQIKNDPELLADPVGWRKREVEKFLGKIIYPIQGNKEQPKGEKQYIVNWIDRATGETIKFPADGVALRIDERNAMIFACKVIKSKIQPLDVWVADENSLRVADWKKIAEFANANGYL